MQPNSLQTSHIRTLTCTGEVQRKPYRTMTRRPVFTAYQDAPSETPRSQHVNFDAMCGSSVHENVSSDAILATAATPRCSRRNRLLLGHQRFSKAVIRPPSVRLSVQSVRLSDSDGRRRRRGLRRGGEHGRLQSGSYQWAYCLTNIARRDMIETMTCRHAHSVWSVHGDGPHENRRRRSDISTDRFQQSGRTAIGLSPHCCRVNKSRHKFLRSSILCLCTCPINFNDIYR
jgi:hypothetical protein